jgi:hypothetical protein
MLCFECLACKASLDTRESEADPIGELCRVCGSLLEPIGDLDEIGYRVFETRGGTSHSGGSRAGGLIAGRVGEIIARRELKHARVRLGIERSDAHSLSPRVQLLALALPAPATMPWRRRRRASTTAGPGDCRASSELSARGVIGANGAARRRFALRRPRQPAQRREPV